MYYVIKIWGFLTPLPFVITFSSEHNQQLSFSDPPPFVITQYMDVPLHRNSINVIEALYEQKEKKRALLSGKTEGKKRYGDCYSI